MIEHPYLFSSLFILAGGWCGYTWGWYRACLYRDKLEARYPRTPIVINPSR